MVRMENNRVDKVLLKEYFKELDLAVKGMNGLTDINSYRKEFEKEFASNLGLPYAIAVNSGTDALHLILLALGIGKGDSVIIPDLTYISTALVAHYVGAELILADVKNTDLTLDESRVAPLIKKNTKAIIAVDMFGNPCEMAALRRIAERNRLFLIEDACQAFGSRYRGKSVGAIADASAFSFSFYKPLSSLAGNGGAIVYHDQKMLAAVNKFLDLWKVDNSISVAGRKFNRISLTDLATVRVKLRFSRQIIEHRDKIKKLYEERLSGTKGVRLFNDRPGFFSVRENFPLLVEKRDLLYSFLKKRGIDTDLPYPPLHGVDFLAGEGKKANFTVTREYFNSGIQLPLFSFMKDKECIIVVDAVKDFISKRRLSRLRR